MIKVDSHISQHFHFYVRICALLCAFTLFYCPLSSAAIESHQDSTSRLFEYDLKYVGSSTTMDLNYKYVMEHLIEILKENPKTKIHIRGHVCCGPNKRISKKRARKVYRFLKKQDIAKERMSYRGYSDEIPLAYPEKTEEDEIKNRRVDFVLTSAN